MADAFENVGFVIASGYRLGVMRTLREGPATPSNIGERTDVEVAHVSRALQQLGERDLVELLVPEDVKKGRLYGLTDPGREIFETIEEHGVSVNA